MYSMIWPMFWEWREEGAMSLLLSTPLCDVAEAVKGGEAAQRAAGKQ